MLSACDSDQGPSSVVSQVYGNINNIFTTLKAEIAVNVFLIVFLSVRLYFEQQSTARQSGQQVVLDVFELFLEVSQIAPSVLVYIDLKATTSAVFLLSEKLIGTFSPDSQLCLLPCCNPAFCLERK
jgi:hypothetical protein